MIEHIFSLIVAAAVLWAVACSLTCAVDCVARGGVVSLIRGLRG
jgi:hypothetical protein